MIPTMQTYEFTGFCRGIPFTIYVKAVTQEDATDKFLREVEEAFGKFGAKELAFDVVGVYNG